MVTQFYRIPALILCTAMLIAASAAQAGPQSYQVTKVELKADNARPTGNCPITVVFHGYITANGPCIVKYTFTRSDGATGPANTLTFKTAGTQKVETTWTLGDARALPQYEGWQAIRIILPNALESSHETGSFKLTCGQSDTQKTPTGERLSIGKQQSPGARVGVNAETVTKNEGAPKNARGEGEIRRDAVLFVQTYKEILARRGLQKKQQLDREMASLQPLSEKYRSALLDAQKKVGFDQQATSASFRAIAAERDPANRQRLFAEFQSKYEPQLEKMAASAGLDGPAIRQQIASAINLPATKALGRRVLEGPLSLGSIQFQDGPPPPRGGGG